MSNKQQSAIGGMTFGESRQTNAQEAVYTPDFNYGEFAIIKIQAGLNSDKISTAPCKYVNSDIHSIQ